MGFGGSTSGANVSLKNNRRSRKSKIEKFRKTTGSNITGIKSENINQEEILAIKRKLNRESKKRQQKILLFTGIIMIVFLIVLWSLMF